MPSIVPPSKLALNEKIVTQKDKTQPNRHVYGANTAKILKTAGGKQKQKQKAHVTTLLANIQIFSGPYSSKNGEWI